VLINEVCRRLESRFTLHTDSQLRFHLICLDGVFYIHFLSCHSERRIDLVQVFEAQTYLECLKRLIFLYQTQTFIYSALLTLSMKYI
jgi:hypothetical protein